MFCAFPVSGSQQLRLLRTHPRVALNSAQHNGIGGSFQIAYGKRFQEEYRPMKRSIITITAFMMLMSLYVPLASAKAIVTGPTIQDPSPEEAAAYKAWFEANNQKDYAKALELAKAYLQKFPNGNAKNIEYLKTKWIPSVRGMMYKEAHDKGDVAGEIRIAKEVLAEDPDNLDYIWAVVVEIRTNEIAKNNFSHAAEVTDLSQRAIRLFESGKTLTGVDVSKFNKNVTLGYLHQTAALVADNSKDSDKALAEYTKASELDPANAAYFFHCGRINNDRYNVAAQKYEAAQKKADAIPEADRNAAEPKPDVKATLDETKAALTEVRTRAEPVINCWARYLGLTMDKPSEARTTVMTVVSGLFKFMNNNSEEGLTKLIEQNKTSPTPVKWTPPPQTTSPKPAETGNAAAKPATGKKPH
jgi:tetratricopeptide (TPR) repeat protein